MNNTVIKIEPLSKIYRLGETGTGFHPGMRGYEILKKKIMIFQ
jgi:hypothetical protein